MSKQLRIAGDPGTLKPIIEALIFASEEPLPARTLVRIISGEEISGRPAGEMDAGEAAGEEQLPLVGDADAPSEERDDADVASEELEQQDAERPGDEEDDEDEIAGESIDLAVGVTTTSQLVDTADDVVEEGAAREPEVAQAAELVETPEEPVAAEAPADEITIPEQAPPAVSVDDEGSEASADAASGEEGEDDEEMVTLVAEEDAPTDADLLATTDPVTLGEPPADDAVTEDGAPASTDEEPEALQEAMERAEARVTGRTAGWLAGDSIDQRYVRILIEELNQDYDETGRAFRIVEVAGGFQFATTRDFGEYVALLSKEKMRRRLSPAALETLSIIAYRQPVSKPEIESIRGVNCDQVLLNLMEKNLISITGRSEGVGRPLLYGTTDEFLRIFGLNNVGDLPKLRELEELMEENVLSPERAEVVTVDENSDVEEIEAKVGAAGHHDDAQLPIDAFIPLAAPVIDESADEESADEESADEESEGDASETEAPDADENVQDDMPDNGETK